MDVNRICEQLNLDPLAHGLQIADAHELARDFFPRLDTDRPALIANLASPGLAHAARRTLLVNYPTSHPLTLVTGVRTRASTLATLTRDYSFARPAVLYVPRLAAPGSPQTVAAIVARLRVPGGCPWDRKQTHASLRRALLEETYEVIEALDENDPVKLREEVGDLLLHVVFQTQIARDQGEFTLAEVGAELAAKLIRRHPHVFGEVEVENADEVVANWGKIKQEEKRAKSPAGGTGAGTPAGPSALDANIPRELPALARAQKVCERARRAGIASKDGGRVEERARKIARARDREKALGELLFALAAYAEENKLDAQSALRAATARFVARNARGRGPRRNGTVRRQKRVGAGSPRPPKTRSYTRGALQFSRTTSSS